MKGPNIEVLKSSGERVSFSMDKLRNSLKRSSADHELVEEIVEKVKEEAYEGITTNEIFNRAYALLKGKKSVFASKYKLKKAIYELGPTGFPFERFVAAILKYSGYHVEVGVILQGICVTHEIDVLAEKENRITVIECKFHNVKGLNCNVKVPLYIHSRYNDVKAHWTSIKKENKKLEKGWVVTNTRFTEDALKYGECSNLYLLSWDYPKEEGLKDRIDRLGLYPITVSSLLSNREKQFLLSRDVVLCRQLVKDKFFLDHLGISQTRKIKILDEIGQLCNI
ncbi:ATP cone domain-containing protein [Maribacter sp. PR1]|uniref:ATP cone domain-containing protein n=1 Tax=Maribacter cobaltidurans TaxID=1178778 RepID=A0ABU7ITU9_9FLAO|nr:MULTISPECIES: ATP cone domain-containing protein [Maribacter]MDC6389012.1 ATP cone domain-containing protein [Maribacter sp. PR1]MEE1976400.1 ATP cone domain-containing protein [Maribacter cobaltidurans]